LKIKFPFLGENMKYRCPACSGEVIAFPFSRWSFEWVCVDCGRRYGVDLDKPKFEPEHRMLSFSEAEKAAEQIHREFLERILEKIQKVKAEEIEEERLESPDENEYSLLSYIVEDFLNGDYEEIFKIPEIWIYVREKVRDRMETILGSKEDFLEEVGAFDLDEFTAEILSDLEYDLDKLLKEKHKPEKQT